MVLIILSRLSGEFMEPDTRLVIIFEEIEGHNIIAMIRPNKLVIKCTILYYNSPHQKFSH